MIDEMIKEIKEIDKEDGEWIRGLIGANLHKMATTLIAVRCGHHVTDEDVRELHSQMVRVKNPVE